VQVHLARRACFLSLVANALECFVERVGCGDLDVGFDACAFPVRFGDGADGAADRNDDEVVIVDAVRAYQVGAAASRLT